MTSYKSLKNIWLSILTFFITSVLLYICISKIDLNHFWEAIREILLSYLCLAFCFTCLILFLSSIQFKNFLPSGVSLSFCRLFQIVSIFAMMVNLVPFWGGHALFIYLVGKREKVGIAPALSALTLEQIADGVAKLFIFALVIFLIPFPAWMQRGIQGLVILVSCVYGIVFYFAIRFRNLNQEKEFSPTGWHKLLHFAANWAYHLHALRSFSKTLVGFSLAVGMKLCEVMAIWMVQKSFSLEFSFPGALLMGAAFCVSTTLPLTPGLIGIIEGTVLLIYQYLGLDASQALALGVVIHAVRALPFLVIGYINSILMGFKRKELLNPEASNL